MDTLLVAYGTLLHRESMATTVGRDVTAGKRFVPVTVRGFRRLCNVRAAHYQPSLRLSREPIESGALNVEPAADASFNGLAFVVSTDELLLLDRRERWYERRIVLVHAFDSGDVIGEGHVYAAPPDASWIERDPQKLLPRWEDVIWPRTGAYRVSDAFGQYFDASTYLADGRTLVLDRYGDLLASMPLIPGP